MVFECLQWKGIERRENIRRVSLKTIGDTTCGLFSTDRQRRADKRQENEMHFSLELLKGANQRKVILCLSYLWGLSVMRETRRGLFCANIILNVKRVLESFVRLKFIPRGEKRPQILLCKAPTRLSLRLKDEKIPKFSLFFEIGSSNPLPLVL